MNLFSSRRFPHSLAQRQTLDIHVGHVGRQLYHGGSLLARLIQRHRHRIAPVARLVSAVPPQSNVLDAGCGGGLLLNCLASRGVLRAGHGFDSSSVAIESAKAAAHKLSALGCAIVPTFECRPVQAGFPEGLFDVVCLIDVMHHIAPSAQEAAFKAAAERVRHGGMLLYKDMCRAPAWRAGMNRLHDLVIAQQWIHYLPIARADAWAIECGLSVECAEWIPMLWYGHELRCYRRAHA